MNFISHLFINFQNQQAYLLVQLFSIMNQFETFCIGFGNDKGQTNKIVLQQKSRKIQIFNLKPSQLENIKIQVKKVNPISLGPLQECIRKKRDRNVLEDLLRVQLNSDINKIHLDCKNMQNKIANDLAVVGAMMQEESPAQKFIERTKASGKDAKKYIQKYKSVDKAVGEYNKHQEMIKKFMQQNKCSRQNAIVFLESNDYAPGLIY